MGNIRNMDAKLIVLSNPAKGHRVVKVLGIRRVNGENKFRPQVQPVVKFFLENAPCRKPLRLCKRLIRKRLGNTADFQHGVCADCGILAVSKALCHAAAMVGMMRPRSTTFASTLSPA